MSSLAIYRKYRPTNFDEVSGQKVVSNILKNAIKNNNISHAYLFTGPRGTGKTSIAKIFARTINCEHLINLNPCNDCECCRNSNSKECVDIIEIDAASNNGVDEIRDLKSKINIVPSFLKYKIYIIDEVHMLSIGAFNALLKTLEEPPSHAIFVLATTEIHKVPSTILSRCQVLEFKRISPTDMKERIINICNKENINIDDESLDEIINFSDGCMRDALSLLEKINSYCDNNILVDDVRNVCGKPTKEHINELIDCVKNMDTEKVVDKINYFYQNDYDMLHIVEDVIVNVEKRIFVTGEKDEINNNVLSEFIKIYDNMKKSSVSKKIIFEIGVLNFFNNEKTKNISREIFYRTKNEQNGEKKEDFQKITLKKEKHIDFSNFKLIRLNNTFYGASKSDLQFAKDIWQKIQKFAFDKEIGSKICLLLDGVPTAASKDYLVLSYQYPSIADKVNESYLELEEVLSKNADCNYRIVAISNDDWKSAKNDYVKKLNAGEKYQFKEDTYVGKAPNEDNVINKVELNTSNDDIEEKVYELFDSSCIEIE